jgi:hypothetical protein
MLSYGILVFEEPPGKGFVDDGYLTVGLSNRLWRTQAQRDDFALYVSKSVPQRPSSAQTIYRTAEAVPFVRQSSQGFPPQASRFNESLGESLDLPLSNRPAIGFAAALQGLVDLRVWQASIGRVRLTGRRDSSAW